MKVTVLMRLCFRLSQISLYIRFILSYTWFIRELTHIHGLVCGGPFDLRCLIMHFHKRPATQAVTQVGKQAGRLFLINNRAFFCLLSSLSSVPNDDVHLLGDGLDARVSTVYIYIPKKSN